MVEPYGQDVFGDSRKIESLSAAIGKDHKIEVHADGHHLLMHVRHVRLVFRHMDGAAEKDQLSEVQPVLSGEEGDIAAVAMSNQVQALFVVVLHPAHKIRSRKRPGGIAVASRPAEAVGLGIKIRPNRLQNISMEIAAGLPPGRVLRPGSVDEHGRIAGAGGPGSACDPLHLP